ncbi:hypothetical protein pb186bvf_021030 [Paramecium bursaria]
MSSQPTQSKKLFQRSWTYVLKILKNQQKFFKTKAIQNSRYLGQFPNSTFQFTWQQEQK